MQWTAYLAEMESWSAGNPFEQRAVVAGLCEPVLLKNPVHAKQVLDRLQQITDGMMIDFRSQERRLYRLTQSFGIWLERCDCLLHRSMVCRACKPLLTSPDKDLSWIARENMKKNRLKKIINSKTTHSF
jgi:hypothetical protein